MAPLQTIPPTNSSSSPAMTGGASSTKEVVPKQSNEEPSRKLVIENIVAGLASGVTGTVIGYPLDLLKTRLQTSRDHKQSTNFFKMTASIWKTEGPRGFFKGLMTPLVSLSLISSITFPCYSWFRVQFGAQQGWDVKNALAGFVCAPITFPITNLEGVVKTQMQVDNIHKKEFQGSWQCFSTLIRVHGPGILLFGTTSTISRDAAYLATYFYVYEGMKATLTGTHPLFSQDTSVFSLRPELAVPLAGGTSGACAWLVSIPFDCVRAGVHSQNLEITSSNPMRKTGRHVFRELMETRGIQALYRGVTPTVMRAFIVSASRFSAYEIALALFRRQQHNGDIE